MDELKSIYNELKFDSIVVNPPQKNNNIDEELNFTVWCYDSYLKTDSSLKEFDSSYEYIDKLTFDLFGDELARFDQSSLGSSEAYRRFQVFQ